MGAAKELGQSSISQQRFIVHRVDQGHATISGSITDTTTFEPVEQVITSGMVVDCHGLGPCSWNGLTNFIPFISDRGLTNVALTDVPAEVYRYLRLIPGVGDGSTVRVIKANIAVRSVANPELKGEQSIHVADTVGQGGALVPDLATGWVGDLANLAAGQGAHLQAASFVEPTYRASAEAVNFWYHYARFSSDTISLTRLMIDSLRFGLHQQLDHLSVRLATVKEHFAQLPGRPSILTPDLRAVAAMVHQRTDTARVRLDEVAAKLDLLAAKVLVNGFDVQLATETQEPRGVVTELQRQVAAVAEITADIEAMGVDLGTAVQAISSADTLREMVQKMPVEQFSATELEEFRAAFLIMDLLSEGDAAQSKVAALEAVSEIDAAIYGCIVHIQGFDLARQVLEHRLAEAQAIAVAMPAGDPEAWSRREVAEAVTTAICAKMVTDQEKRACQFYFPSEFAAAEAAPSEAAGSVLLF